MIGANELRYVARDPARSIDVGGQLLDAITRLARWWGIPLATKALGYGGYRIRIEQQRGSRADGGRDAT